MTKCRRRKHMQGCAAHLVRSAAHLVRSVAVAARQMRRRCAPRRAVGSLLSDITGVARVAKKLRPMVADHRDQCRRRLLPSRRHKTYCGRCRPRLRRRARPTSWGSRRRRRATANILERRHEDGRRWLQFSEAKVLEHDKSDLLRQIVRRLAARVRLCDCPSTWPVAGTVQAAAGC